MDNEEPILGKCSLGHRWLVPFCVVHTPPLPFGHANFGSVGMCSCRPLDISVWSSPSHSSSFSSATCPTILMEINPNSTGGTFVFRRQLIGLLSDSLGFQRVVEFVTNAPRGLLPPELTPSVHAPPVLLTPPNSACSISALCPVLHPPPTVSQTNQDLFDKRILSIQTVTLIMFSDLCDFTSVLLAAFGPNSSHGSTYVVDWPTCPHYQCQWARLWAWAQAELLHLALACP